MLYRFKPRATIPAKIAFFNHKNIIYKIALMLVSIIGGFTILYNGAVEIRMHIFNMFKIELILCLEHKFVKIKKYV